MTATLTRVFLVGCPRSGTTLVQSLLAAHPLVVSFPETHFFRFVAPQHRLPRALGLASSRARSRIGEFASELGRPELMKRFPFHVTARGATRSFVRLLDDLAHEQEARMWVEKTPGHLHHIAPIEQRVAGARFVHVVRNGEDVVASMYEVTHAHPDVWGGARSLDECIDRWLGDLAITRGCAGRRDHCIVRYETLVERPHGELERLCSFLELEYVESMLELQADAAEPLVLDSEPWKERAKMALQMSERRKFDELFDDYQRRHVTRRLAGADLMALEHAI